MSIDKSNNSNNGNKFLTYLRNSDKKSTNDNNAKLLAEFLEMSPTDKEIIALAKVKHIEIILRQFANNKSLIENSTVEYESRIEDLLAEIDRLYKNPPVDSQNYIKFCRKFIESCHYFIGVAHYLLNNGERRNDAQADLLLNLRVKDKFKTLKREYSMLNENSVTDESSLSGLSFNCKGIVKAVFKNDILSRVIALDKSDLSELNALLQTVNDFFEDNGIYVISFNDERLTTENKVFFNRANDSNIELPAIFTEVSGKLEIFSNCIGVFCKKE